MKQTKPHIIGNHASSTMAYSEGNAVFLELEQLWTDSSFDCLKAHEIRLLWFFNNDEICLMHIAQSETKIFPVKNNLPSDNNFKTNFGSGPIETCGLSALTFFCTSLYALKSNDHIFVSWSAIEED